MSRGRKKYICIDCKTRPVNLGVKRTGTFLCNKCYDLQNEQLKSKVLDVETYDEDRLLFLARMSKQVGKDLSAKEIRSMVDNGMTDEQILRTRPLSIWTYGCEVSPEPMHFKGVGNETR